MVEEVSIMRYNLDTHTKAIVYVIIKDQPARDARKRKGRYTKFDKRADAAVTRAREQIKLRGYGKDVREQMIEKIQCSIRDNTPWEMLGEVYCGRRMFYEHRKEFCYYVAAAMDMVE